jgi:lipopolysaccharide export system permease protein
MHGKLELIVMRVLGITTVDILKSLFIAITILGVFYITILDSLSAFSVNKTTRLDAKLKQDTRGIDNSLVVVNRGIWFRDVYKFNSYIIYAKSFNRRNNSLFNVRVFEFDENNDLKLSVYSHTATISKGYWKFNDAKVITVDNTENISSFVEIPTQLSISSISKMTANPDSISFWNIRKYASILNKIGLSNIKYIVHWFFRFSTIFQMFAFVMLSTAFCIDYLSRNIKRYSLKIASLLSIAVPIYFFNNVLIALGESGNVPIAFSAFIVPVFSIIIGGILLHGK